MKQPTKADELRAALKLAGYSRTQVSVRYDHSSLEVTIRDAAVAKSAILAIAGEFENIRRDEATGEILGGGNTFVEVKYLDAVIDPLALPIAEQLFAAVPNTSIELAGRTVSKMAPSTGRWDWTVVSFDNLEPRLHLYANDATLLSLMSAARTLAEGQIELQAKAIAGAQAALRQVADVIDAQAEQLLAGDDCDVTHGFIAALTGAPSTPPANEVEDWAAGMEAH